MEPLMSRDRGDAASGQDESVSSAGRRAARERRIRDYLARSRELAGLCEQNGWIDNDSLQIEWETSADTEARVSVHFTEVIMEGAGCVADRRERFGRLILAFTPDGEIASCKLE
jgi:hypothetical protein